MSRISLSSNPSGTGVVTIASPATNIDRTLTLPDASGSVNVSGTVNVVPAGSASTPSISPDGDTNTGIFFPAADTVAVATNGVERLRINGNGNITTPAQPSIYLDGNNWTQINFTTGQQILTSTYFQQKHIRGGISWNGTTGAVTVPTAGHYLVSYAGYENVSTGRVTIAVNGANVQLVHWGGMGTRSISFVVSLAANDYLQVVAAGEDLPQLYMGPVHNYFCAYLLG